MARPAVLWIKDPARWRVLLSPARMEILQALRCLGPASVAELATLVDRPADLLYRQLEKLKGAGIVVESGVRKRNRHAERLFDVAADDFAIDFDGLQGEPETAAIVETGRSFCTGAQRALEDSATAGALRIKGDDRNFVVNYELSWLTPEAFKRVRGLMYQVKQVMDESRGRGEGTLYVSVTVLAPVTRRRRRAGAKPARPRAPG